MMCVLNFQQITEAMFLNVLCNWKRNEPSAWVMNSHALFSLNSIDLIQVIIFLVVERAI